MAASAIVPGVFIRSASAQVSDRYHVIELQPVEGRNRAIPYAINSDGLIVGVSLTESGSDPLPTLWVPCAGGCCPPSWTAVNLMTVGSGGGLGGEARDINDAGLVAGWRNYPLSEATSGSRPYVWDTAIPANSVLLSDLSQTVVRGGKAWGVNEQSPALVVGGALTDLSCFGNPANKLVHAFVWEEGAAPTDLLDLAPESGESLGRAVNSVANWPTVAGVLGACGASAICDSDRTATVWTLDPVEVGSGPLQEVVPLGASAAASDALSINDDVLAVGFQRYEPGSLLGEGCFSKAAFWNEAGFVTDLHQFTGLSIEKETVANAISEAIGSCYRVVGESPDQGIAYRRTLSNGIWTAEEFDGLLDGFGGAWEVLEAKGINGSQWVVGTARTSVSPIRRPVVLIHRPCLINFDGNGTVDAGDLAILLGAWGAATSCGAFDEPDIDMNGEVDASDLATLLGFWGSSCSDACAVAEFGAGQFAMSAASSSESLIDQETLLQLAGFPSTSAFINWASGASSSERIGIAALVVALAEGGAN
jgi:hypothetical protein